MSKVPAVLSVDLEYFGHTPAYRGAGGRADDPAVGVERVSTLLDMLSEADATATFFTVSSVVDETPGVVERVAEAGHEVASHTHTHPHLSELSRGERLAELETSKRRLEAAVGRPVTGFRAPSFDTSADHFRLLAEAGYSYDSSVVPCRSIPGWYGGEHDVRRPVPASAVDPDAPSDLAELPVAVMPGVGLPLTGTWLRFFGVRYTVAGMRLLARQGVPPVLYVHPWELADLPAVEGVPSRVYVRTGAYMRRAVRRILSQPFEFVPAERLAAEATRPADDESGGPA